MRMVRPSSRMMMLIVVGVWMLVGCAKVNRRSADHAGEGGADTGDSDTSGAGSLQAGHSARAGSGGRPASGTAGSSAAGRGGMAGSGFGGAGPSGGSGGAAATGNSAGNDAAGEGGNGSAGVTAIAGSDEPQAGTSAADGGRSGNPGTAGSGATSGGTGGTGSSLNCGPDDTACAPSGAVQGYCKANACVSCSAGVPGNAACSAAYGNGAGYVCVAGNCLAGQCASNAECSPGQLCGAASANQCGSCSGDAQCTSSSSYGTGYLCIGGACVSADCRADNDCQSGQICGLNVPNRCAGCAVDDQCHNDTTSYGSSFICDTSAGRCVAGSCTPNNQVCSKNSADFCCAAACVAGNCCSSLDCAGMGNNVTCTNHVCTQCAQATANTYYVDPVAGNDSVGTGYNAAGCAFRTISRALAVIGSTPNPGTRVLVQTNGVVGVAQSGEMFPIDVPTNVTIAGSGGRAQIEVPANTNGFALHHPGSGLTNLTIDGQSNAAAYGVYVSSGADATTSISALDVQYMGRDGIRLVGSAVLSIAAGVRSSFNGTSGVPADGLSLTDQARVKINVTSGDPVHFDRNTARGIYVTKAAAIELTGTAGTAGNGSVTSNSNASAGLWIEQTPASGLPLNTITGLVTWANTGNGIRIMGGSAARVRQSFVLANGSSGIQVSTYVNGLTRNNDTSKINLGTTNGPSYGGNTLQAALGNNPNAGAGICLAVDRGAGAVLNAAGNIFAGPIDCASSTATLRKNTRCSASTDYSVRNSGGMPSTIVIARCQ
jgi:hypothetical protein